MDTLKYQILEYLRSGNARSMEYNKGIVKQWERPGETILKDIVLAKEPVENPLIRTAALHALSYALSKDDIGQVLGTLLNEEPDEHMRLKVFGALANGNLEVAAQRAEGFIEQPEKNIALAMASARVLAQTKGKEAIPAIEKLQQAILEMADGNMQSPSYKSMLMLVAELKNNKKKTEDRAIKEE